MPLRLPHVVVLEGVANEGDRERAVARVAQHRVDHDRRVADREKAASPDDAGDREENVVLPVSADDEYGREGGLLDAGRVVGHDLRDVVHRRVLDGGLRDREGRIAPQHLGGSARQRPAADVELREELVAGAVVVQEDDSPAGTHERRQLVDIELPGGMDEHEGVGRSEAVQIEGRGRKGPRPPELGLCGVKELREPLPIFSLQIERCRERRGRADEEGGRRERRDRKGCQGRGEAARKARREGAEAAHVAHVAHVRDARVASESGSHPQEPQ